MIYILWLIGCRSIIALSADVIGKRLQRTQLGTISDKNAVRLPAAMILNQMNHAFEFAILRTDLKGQEPMLRLTAIDTQHLGIRIKTFQQ